MQIEEFVAMENSSLDEGMKLEKIGAFAQKMPLMQLRAEMERTIESVSCSDKRDQLVKLVADLLRQKNDPKGAESL
jgi:hypothetical protein